MTSKDWLSALFYIAVFLLGFDYLRARRLERQSLAGKLLRRLRNLAGRHSE
ncbi:MAG: hypothetical protein ACC613_01005 [Synergistales bacterium]